MKQLMLATLAGAALLAGAGAASAQNLNGFGYSGYGYHGEPDDYGATGVGVQVGPVAGFVSAPVAGVGPSYGYGAAYDYGRGSGSHFVTPWNSSAPRGGTYKMEAFKQQELMPQSPPGGGY